MSKILKEHEISIIHQHYFDKELEIRCKSSNIIGITNQKKI